MPAGRGRGKPRATPLRTGPGRAGPGGAARPAGCPDPMGTASKRARRRGAVRRQRSRDGVRPSPPLVVRSRLRPAEHSDRPGIAPGAPGPARPQRRAAPDLPPGPGNPGRQSARAGGPGPPARPPGSHPGGGRRADGPRRSPGGGRRRAHPGPGERGRRAPPDLASGGPPGSRREEEPSRGAVPRAREREREPPAGRRERGPRRPAARGLRRRGPDGRGAAEQSGGPPPRRGGRRVPAPQGATWLILPVVICLSQRLSHACLSKSFPKRNCGWLIKSVMVPWSASPYMDNCGNSRANTCQQAPTLREACFY